MKNLGLILVAVVMGFFLVAGSAMAYPFIEVSGRVIPDYASLSDQGDGTSLIHVEYIFRVDYADPGAYMNSINIEFEHDVFPDDPPFPNTWSPGDWTLSSTSSSSSFYGMAQAGTTLLGQGECFTMALEDLRINTPALTDPTYWNEGGIWEQSFVARDTKGGVDGGSTSPTPEPATMLLFGSGLLGLAGLGRKIRKW